jgi:predicted Fe-S protein YdhL (DUF1289 family)
MSQKIDSPCIRICTLDDCDCCLGCGRTLEEIKRWAESDHQERELILELANKRIQKMYQRSPGLQALHQSRKSQNKRF